MKNVLGKIAICFEWVTAIVTHGGNAHRDDFIAVCLVLGAKLLENPKAPLPPVFRETDLPTEVPSGEMRIDVGEGDFDHHQLTPDRANPVCAITRVLEYVGEVEKAREAFPWLRTTEVLDCFGPKAQAEELETTMEVTEALRSPVEGTLLHMFALQKGEVDEILTDIMAAIGVGLWEVIQKEYDKEVTFRNLWESTSRHIVHGDAVRVATGVTPEEAALVQEWEEKTGWPLSQVIVSRDNRGEGYALYRVDDAPGWDFTRIKDREEIAFAHKNGFIAKTHERVSPAVLMELLEASSFKPAS